jgi:hypothetical protein
MKADLQINPYPHTDGRIVIKVIPGNDEERKILTESKIFSAGPDSPLTAFNSASTHQRELKNIEITLL